MKHKMVWWIEWNDGQLRQARWYPEEDAARNAAAILQAKDLLVSVFEAPKYGRGAEEGPERRADWCEEGRL